MNNDYYFYVDEMSSDGKLTPQKISSMGIIEKIISPLLREDIEKAVRDLLKEVYTRNSQLDEEVKSLSEIVSELSKKVEKNSKINEILLAEYNTKKASSESKYKEAVDIFYKLNIRFKQNVPSFGRVGRLDVIQMLVEYLYNPTDAIREKILSTAPNDKVVSSILNDIDNFDTKYRPKLMNYLSEISMKWDDCVLFPNKFTFDPSAMRPFNDPIEEGVPVYIVSLGYRFPNSNSEEHLPIVFAQKMSN